MEKSLLTMTNVTKGFRKRIRSGKEIRAVSNLSLEVAEGEIFGFLGPNGAGKSTTIRLMLGLLYPDEGEIRIGGENIQKNKKKALQGIGALVEGPAFYPYLTGFENLEIFGAYSGSVSKTRIEELINTVGLRGREHERVAAYSMGMKQRLGIAQALLNRPRLIILDEPTNGLDPHGMRDIRRLIFRLSRELNTTIFLSSHILHEVQQICDRVAIINKGKTIVIDAVKELHKKSNRIYEIDTPEPTVVETHLRKNPAYEVIQTDPLRVDLLTGSADELLSHLIQKGVRLTSFKPVELTLEDYFLSSTNESVKEEVKV